MNKQLSCVLLIDDDAATNFLHEMVIEEARCAKKSIVAPSGYAALDFLKQNEDQNQTQPELIFLDINMPGMNGWEFIEAYKKLDEIKQANSIIVMLSTSLNPKDKEKAHQIEEITTFRNKPLTVRMVQELLGEYFPDRL